MGGWGDVGTILLVLAVGWGIWTFALSPDAETNRDIGGGIFGGLTGNKDAVENAVDKVGGKFIAGVSNLSKKCPMCMPLDKTPSNECIACARSHRGEINDAIRNEERTLTELSKRNTSYARGSY